MVTLTYWELGLVVSGAVVFVLAAVVIAQAFGSDDAIRSIVSRLRDRLRARSPQTPEQVEE